MNFGKKLYSAKKRRLYNSLKESQIERYLQWICNLDFSLFLYIYLYLNSSIQINEIPNNTVNQPINDSENDLNQPTVNSLKVSTNPSTIQPINVDESTNDLISDFDSSSANESRDYSFGDNSFLQADISLNEDAFASVLDDPTLSFSMLNPLQQEKIITFQNYLGLFLNQIRHNFTDVAVVDIAAMTNIGKAPESEKLCKSYETMCKHARIFRPTMYHYFYCDCGVMGPVSNDKMSTAIACATCKKSIIPSQIVNKPDSTYFCYIQIKQSLERLLPQIHKYLRFDLPQCDDLFDVTSGSEYKRLANQNTIVIYFGFDGVLYTEEKGGKSMWPFINFICELPLNLRSKFAFPIAIHAGPDQPTCHMLTPFVEELRRHLNEPINVTIKCGNDLIEKKFFIKLLFGVCDAPARAKVLNMLAHNGKYGCNICKVKSSKSKEFGCMVFPMDYEPVLRTDQEWRSIVSQIMTTSNIKSIDTFGLKGFTPLLNLPYVNMVNILPIDYMHSMFLGSFKLMLDNWLGTDKRSSSCLDKDSIQLLNNQLKLIRFPTKVLRQIPPKLSVKLKAMELENVLFYGFVLFENILPADEFELLKLLAYILSTLSSRRISHAQIDFVESLIKKFLSKYSEVYKNDEFLFKYNAHLLLHLPISVRLFGPLNGTSAYQLEDLVGDMADLVNSPTKIPEQVLNKAVTSHSILVTVMSRYSIFTDEFKNSLPKYYPTLFSSLVETREPRKSMQVYYLEPEELSLLSSIQDVQLIDLSTARNIEKTWKEKHFMCSNKHNYRNSDVLSATDNHFIMTESQKYYQIEKIIRIDKIDYLFGYEFIDILPYHLYVNTPYGHVKLSKTLSSKLDIILLKDVICPFSRIYFNGSYILYDLFNRHK